MNWPRLIAAFLAITLHGGVFYTLFAHAQLGALTEGSGPDNFTVVATVNLESADLFTQDASKPAEEAIASKAERPNEERPETVMKEEEVADKLHEAPPSQEGQRPPEKQQERNQAASAAAPQLDAQQAAAALASRRDKIWSAYEVELHSALERHKLKPLSAKTGEVLLKITIAPTGQLLSQSVLKSSGVPELDRAAIASIEQALPFPPIPQEIASGPLTLTVPFRYQTR